MDWEGTQEPSQQLREVENSLKTEMVVSNLKGIVDRDHRGWSH